MINYSNTIKQELQTISATFESEGDRESTVQEMNGIIQNRLSMMTLGTTIHEIKCEQGNDGKFHLKIKFAPPPLDKIYVNMNLTPNRNQFNIHSWNKEASYD
ncbi:hypothetical protein_gp279 [Bacillus phage vB_BceM_WH1]|nr:hypothetical protein_gp279 [Bacillus phage vB_BceM_WH1]